MNKKNEIENSFFDLLAFVLSLFLSFFRSTFLFFKTKKIKTNIFFDFLDFLFRKWPKYFWDKPSFYKATSFLSDLLNNILKK